MATERAQADIRPELKVHRESRLPLNTSPLKFAVLNKDGTSSNAWGVIIEKDGSAYVYCRDNMKEIKGQSP